MLLRNGKLVLTADGRLARRCGGCCGGGTCPPCYYCGEPVQNGIVTLTATRSLREDVASNDPGVTTGTLFDLQASAVARWRYMGNSVFRAVSGSTGSNPGSDLIGRAVLAYVQPVTGFSINANVFMCGDFGNPNPVACPSGARIDPGLVSLGRFPLQVQNLHSCINVPGGGGRAVWADDRVSFGPIQSAPGTVRTFAIEYQGSIALSGSCPSAISGRIDIVDTFVRTDGFGNQFTTTITRVETAGLTVTGFRLCPGPGGLFGPDDPRNDL